MNISDITRMIRLSDLTYPIYLSTVRSENPTMSFGRNPSEETILGLGYAVVHETPRPEGDVVEEDTPVIVDGVWRQTWKTRAFNGQELFDQLQQMKARMLEDVSRLRDEAFEKGLLHTFSDGSLGHIQLREKDQINLHSVRLRAEAMIAMGQPGAQVRFRTLENETKLVEAQEVLDIINRALAYGEEIYAVSWALKDQIAFAVDVSHLPVLSDKLIP